MFCYKCGERLWDGRTSCQKCGADVPLSVLEADKPPVEKWPLYATGLGLLASAALGFTLGNSAFRIFHAGSRVEVSTQRDEITPLNARDPSALVMGSSSDLDPPRPAKKTK